MSTTNPLNDPVKQREAQNFSEALISYQAMLTAYATLLAKKVDKPEDRINAANDFIQHKTKNGEADYQTDFDYVLQAQQTMPSYMLLYWSGIYATKIGLKGEKKTETGPEFSIAATLDTKAPVHIGLDKAQIVSPTFAGLVLEWKKSEVQQTSAKLIFNLVPDASGQTHRTFAGTYTDASGATKLFTGIAKNPIGQTAAEKDKEKFALPPALQVIFPAIAAIGTVVAVTAAIVAISWTTRQWKDRNAKAAAAEAEAAANPGDQAAADQAAAAQDQAAAAGQAADVQAPALGDGGDAVAAIPPGDHADAVDDLVGDVPAGPIPDNAEVVAQVAAEVEEDPDLEAAQEQLEVDADPAPVVQEGEGEGEVAGGVAVEDGPLNPIEEGD